MDTNKFKKVVKFQLDQELSKASPRITGQLARSFIINSKILNNKIVYKIPFYAKYVEFGTMPYYIYPKKTQGVLKFKKGNKTIFTKKVSHPGIRSNPFIRRTLKTKMKDIILNALNASK